MMFDHITKTDHNQNGPLPKRTTLKRTITEMDYQKKYVLQESLFSWVFLVCVDCFFFKTYLICDNYFLDLWINQISTGNLVKTSNYWCCNWFMTPKSLCDCVSVCCLEFIFLEQSAQWSVRMIMNENKLHVLLLSMNQRSKKFTRFCDGIYQNSMYCNRLIIS